jgi:signal transduction histidine kinase
MKLLPLSRSLRQRLLAATVMAVALALLLAGIFLNSLFRTHVLKQFQLELVQHLDQLTGQLEVDATLKPTIDVRTLTDPRWQRPFSGLYWQLDRVSADGLTRSGVLRSRSLWDSQLALDADVLPDGGLHVHQGVGPKGEELLLVERTVRFGQNDDSRWRLIVAADTRDQLVAIAQFRGVLMVSLLVLGMLLVLAALAQVALGLSPLRALQKALKRVREGQDARLDGRFPAEVQPLIDDFNGVLERNAMMIERARTQAGNLAHAIKTPLAVLGQAAEQALRDTTQPEPSDHRLALLVQEQIATARRHVDWHLARSRAAATQGASGRRTLVAPVVQGLVRAMQRIHAARQLNIDTSAVSQAMVFDGEEQDLHDLLGNLIDNACKWAHATVRVSGASTPGWISLLIEDDGPGIDDRARDSVLSRGTRLDETVPGSGLGLAIVMELAQLYGGNLNLSRAPLGGLRAELRLPASKP